MELLKTILFVSGAAAAGSFAADFAEPKITPRLQKQPKPATQKAVRLAVTASVAVISFGILRALF